MKYKRIACPLLVVSMMFLVLSECFSSRATEDNTDMIYVPNDLNYTGLPETVFVGDSGQLEYQWPLINGIQTYGEVKILAAGSFAPDPTGNYNNPDSAENNPVSYDVLSIHDDYSWTANAAGVFLFSEQVTYSEECVKEFQDAGYSKGLFTTDEMVVHRIIVASDDSPVTRLYNSYTGEHLYTIDPIEKQQLIDTGWTEEANAWVAPGFYSTSDYITRMFNPYADEHLYTTDENEIHTLLSQGWVCEGKKIPYTVNGNTPVYRLFNPFATTNTHLFTTDSNEVISLQQQGWVYEGIAWCGQ